MKLDMNALMKQAQEMQEQMARAQEEAKNEIGEASAGGGMVTVKANGAGELLEIAIDPRAVDPDDPEMLADMVLAAANEALRAATGAVDPRGIAARRSDTVRTGGRHADAFVQAERGLPPWARGGPEEPDGGA